MGKLSKIIMSTVVAVMFSAGTAMAFSGASIGIIGNAAKLKASGEEVEGANGVGGGNETTTASVSNNVQFGGVFVEVTAGTEHLSFTVGVEATPGSASWDSVTRTDTAVATALGGAENDTGDYKASAEVEDLYTIYAEPGIMFNDNFGLYLKGGASRITVNSLESITQGDDSSAYGNVDVWGVMYGAGFKGIHSSGLFVKVEYTKTDFQEFTLTSSTGNKNSITAEPEIESARLAIGYNF